MEVRYQIFIYAAIALFVVFFILTFIPMRGHWGKYKKGKKVGNAFFIREDSVFKSKMFTYKVLTFLMVFLCCISIVLSTFMISRPYRREVVQQEKYTRDIFLCIDISSSVDELNVNIISNLKDIVSNMQGERFGLVIFNTSPVLLVPLTDDYEYVLEELDRVETHIKKRITSWEDDEDSYINQGTIIQWQYRGSSLIGDGLASAMFDFNDLNDEEAADRTRIIILTTDNQLNGTPYVTIDEAAEMCKSHDVLVYGVGTDTMTKAEKTQMKNAVELTGGKFYLEGQTGTYESIVKDIQRDTKAFVDHIEIVDEHEIVELPFIVLVAVITAMFVVTRVARH